MNDPEQEKINDGGPAYPSEQGHCPNGTWNQTYDSGMSLRDYFAAHAPDLGDWEPEKLSKAFDIELPDTKASFKKWAEFWVIVESKHRYFYADSMIKARSKQ